MSIMKKENFKPLAVLTVICIVVAALLASINIVTAPEIEGRRLKSIQESLHKVMPDGEFNKSSDELRDDVPVTVKEVYTEKNGKGYVVVLLTNKGYTGKNIGLTVAIDKEGKIINASITQNEESIVPEALKPGGNYGDSYIGATADTLAEVVTGATVKFTESAIKNAIDDAFVYLGFKEKAPEPELPKTDEEIAALASELVGEGAFLSEIALDGAEYVKRAYRDGGDRGYVAYLVVYSPEYGTVETETLIHFDNSGEIVSVNKLTWKVSDPIYGYVPPTAETVDAFYALLLGNTSASFAEKFVKEEGEDKTVEVVTNATNTTKRLVVAIEEAFEIVDGLVSADAEDNNVARIVGIAVASASAILVIGAVGYTKIKRRSLK